MTGYTEDELKHIDWNTQLTPPEWRAHEAAFLADLHHTRKPVRYEKEYIRKNGSRVPVELLVHPRLDDEGNLTSYFAFVTDITERKRNADELLENEATLRAILNAVTETVIMIDLAGTILMMNNTAAYRFGQTPDELVGTTSWNMLPPKVAESRKRQFERVIKTGRTAHFEDQRAGIWYETTIYPIFDAVGHVTRTVIFARDITERKQVEQSQLAYALEKERTNILRSFIQQASHEFRTPLSTINTSAYMIENTIDQDLQQHHATIIKAQTKAIATLVNALMTMVQVDNTQALDVAHVELTSLIEMIAQARRDAFSEKHLRCSVETRVRPLIIKGNMKYLQQAIECLVDNAIRFTPDGGSVRITIDIASNSLSQLAVIAITDTGVGISADDLPHIFDRFFRADRAGTTRGFGLGLSIVKTIIEHHQGLIEVESTPSVGSTFTVYLPMV